MPKKIVLICIVVLTLGGVIGFWIKSKNAENEIRDLEGIIDTNSAWNPYAEDYNYIYTLSDFLLSADQGRYVVKMTLTLNFSNKENYFKFRGMKDMNSGKIDSSEDEGIVTPMEFLVNDLVGDLMLKAEEELLVDRENLKKYLLDGINEKIKSEPKLIKDVYIENYVIQ